MECVICYIIYAMDTDIGAFSIGHYLPLACPHSIHTLGCFGKRVSGLNIVRRTEFSPTDIHTG